MEWVGCREISWWIFPFTFLIICGMVGFIEYETGVNIHINKKIGKLVCMKPTKGVINQWVM